MSFKFLKFQWATSSPSDLQCVCFSETSNLSFFCRGSVPRQDNLHLTEICHMVPVGRNDGIEQINLKCVPVFEVVTVLIASQVSLFIQNCDFHGDLCGLGNGNNDLSDIFYPVQKGKQDSETCCDWSFLLIVHLYFSD